MSLVQPSATTTVTPPSLPPFVTKQELAELLRVSPRTLERMVHARAIPAIKIGPRAIRFKTAAVLDALARRTLEAAA